MSPTAPEITEAQAIAFLAAYARSLFDRYPQINESAVSLTVYAGRNYHGHNGATVHLIGHQFRECGIASELTKAEADAARFIDTPDKILERAREAARQATENLARLEGAS